MWNLVYEIGCTGIIKDALLLHVYFICYFETTYTYVFSSPEETYEGLPCSQCRGRKYLAQSGWSICQPYFYIADPLQGWVAAQPRLSRPISLISLILPSPLHSCLFCYLLSSNRWSAEPTLLTVQPHANIFGRQWLVLGSLTISYLPS